MRRIFGRGSFQIISLGPDLYKNSLFISNLPNESQVKEAKYLFIPSAILSKKDVRAGKWLRKMRSVSSCLSNFESSKVS